MKKTLHFLSNKFIFTAIGFVVWMCFFDQNNWLIQNKRKAQLNATEKNIAYLNTEIEGMENEYKRIISDPVYLEKFAREHFKMKRDNEDIYVVEK